MEQDIAIAENYLLLQQLRYDDKFSYRVDTKGEIESFQLPPMLTQPFIENAVKHGVGEMQLGGEINVCYNVEDENIIIEITDNGLGINNDEKSKNNHKSYAISLTKERLDIVGKGSKVVLISPISESGGTKVILTIAKELCLSGF